MFLDGFSWKIYLLSQIYTFFWYINLLTIIKCDAFEDLQIEIVTIFSLYFQENSSVSYEVLSLDSHIWMYFSTTCC